MLDHENGNRILDALLQLSTLPPPLWPTPHPEYPPTYLLQCGQWCVLRASSHLHHHRPKAPNTAATFVAPDWDVWLWIVRVTAAYPG